jgi:hypothetical protein
MAVKGVLLLGVMDRGTTVIVFFIAAGGKRKEHQNGQKQCQNAFHNYYLSFC